MATAMAATKLGNPKNPTDLNLTPVTEDTFTATESPSPGGDDDTKGILDAVVEVKTNDGDEGGSATDIQKKFKRAERFGVAVHLSEKEKRSSRAERFGTAAAANDGSDTSKQSEELKRKARAERFGTLPSVSVDDEAKKKARLSRFGSTPVTDPAEEDKKKARALRFSQQPSSLKENGNGNIEVKAAAVPGKAGAEI